MEEINELILIKKQEIKHKENQKRRIKRYLCLKKMKRLKLKLKKD
jgi:hypothetical protein